MAGRAAADQLSRGYNKDVWTDGDIVKGSYVLASLPEDNNNKSPLYFTFLEAWNKAGGNKEKFWGSVQVPAHETKGLRPRTGLWKARKNAKIAYNEKAEANIEGGDGGAPQGFTDKFDDVFEFVAKFVFN